MDLLKNSADHREVFGHGERVCPASIGIVQHRPERDSDVLFGAAFEQCWDLVFGIREDGGDQLNLSLAKSMERVRVCDFQHLFGFAPDPASALGGGIG